MAKMRIVMTDLANEIKAPSIDAWIVTRTPEEIKALIIKHSTSA